jgi:hypothetical protein
MAAVLRSRFFEENRKMFYINMGATALFFLPGCFWNPLLDMTKITLGSADRMLVLSMKKTL